MDFGIKKTGDWGSVQEIFDSLPRWFTDFENNLKLRLAVRYTEIVILELSKTGHIVPDNAIDDNGKRVDFSNSVMLSFIKVTMDGSGNVFAGINRKIYISNFDVLGFFFKKEFGMTGRAGAGIWRKAYVKLRNELPEIVKEELSKFKF